MKRGAFVVFEGGEGTGKTTQIHSLQKFLSQKNIEVVLTWEPGGTPLGSSIREALISKQFTGMSAKCEALLYAAVRAEHVDKVIRPALERGAVVLCDRYWDASRAYQGFARGLGMNIIDNINFWATEGLFPDRVYLFDLDPAIGLARAKSRGSLDRIEEESIEFHRKILKAYLYIAGADKDRYCVLDAAKEVEVLRKKIEHDYTAHFLKDAT